MLEQWLSPHQLEQYLRNRWFEVVGSKTGKRYRVHRGRQMNVSELDRNGQEVARLCFVPDGRLPIGDVMLAQKIALETNEPGALKVAVRENGHVFRWDLAPGQMMFLEDDTLRDLRVRGVDCVVVDEIVGSDNSNSAAVTFDSSTWTGL